MPPPPLSHPLLRGILPAALIPPLAVIYGVGAGLMCIPFIQKHVLFLHAIKIPLFANFDTPEIYGLAPGKALNIKITTSDNVNLGAWFILSDPFYQSLPFPPSASTLRSNISAALASRPTILVLHGNSATRAMGFRVTHYQLFSSRLGANVLAIDYRGFADSEGTPSEEGLGLDARAAFDWLVQHRANSADILIFGHSLGTSVATGLAAQLTRDDIAFRGLVLSAPFSSLRAVLDGYTTLELPPLMKPLGLLSLKRSVSPCGE